MEIVEQFSLAFAETFEDALRTAQYGVDGSSVPAGMVRLETEADQQLLLGHLQRQARMEQEGNTPGDIASTVVQNPAVQEAIDASR